MSRDHARRQRSGAGAYKLAHTDAYKCKTAVLTHTGLPEQGSRTQTALMHASIYGMTGVVQKLVAAGAKAEMTDAVQVCEACPRCACVCVCVCARVG